MDIFAQKKFLVRIVVVLAILNVFSIGAFFWKQNLGRKEPPLFRGGDNRDVSGILKQELDLTNEQVAQLQKIRADFFEKEQLLARRIRDKRDSMNETMFNKITDEDLLKNLARGVAEGEYQMELLRIDQAQQVKAVCTHEQVEKFEGLVREIRDYFRPDNRPKERPR
jgi:Spy/CpxP family protein refolding chaperone